jgi:hypothetical protein
MRAPATGRLPSRIADNLGFDPQACFLSLTARSLIRPFGSKQRAGHLQLSPFASAAQSAVNSGLSG